jgi:uncharacterized protein YndB with AHSA1/START domain
MAAIAESIEIARRPEDVFSYASDPSKIPEWQASAVSVRREGTEPAAVGSRVAVTRRMGSQERTMTSELTALDPPTRLAGRGIDGPVRVAFDVTVAPLEGGARSRVTISLEPEGRGIGKLLVPLFVRRQLQQELPANLRKLKELLEGGA